MVMFVPKPAETWASTPRATMAIDLVITTRPKSPESSTRIFTPASATSCARWKVRQVPAPRLMQSFASLPEVETNLIFCWACAGANCRHRMKIAPDAARSRVGYGIMVSFLGPRAGIA